MIFSKKTTRVVSIPKIMKIYSPVWKCGSKNFSTENFFGCHLSHMETQLHAKKQKKISKGQGCRTGTDRRTDARTRVNLQVPSGVQRHPGMFIYKRSKTGHLTYASIVLEESKSDQWSSKIFLPVYQDLELFHLKNKKALFCDQYCSIPKYKFIYKQ